LKAIHDNSFFPAAVIFQENDTAYTAKVLCVFSYRLTQKQCWNKGVYLPLPRSWGDFVPLSLEDFRPARERWHILVPEVKFLPMDQNKNQNLVLLCFFFLHRKFPPPYPASAVFRI